MVLINDKKFACATCIKGHRVSGCKHTERPLFEIKKKGRPSTQCQCCKDRRKGSSVHTKCVCGDDSKDSEAAGEEIADAGPSGLNGVHTPLTEISDEGFVETKKGQPGSSATFPNGFKDVHEMMAAAEPEPDPLRSAERSVQRLLNPCTCKHTGICKCCEPKRPPRKHHGRTHSPSSGSHQLTTEDLVELFKSRAPMESHSPSSASPSSPQLGSASSATSRFSFSHHLPVPDISPENPHHPAHTSKHVHKTKLYSPYAHSPNSRHGKRESISRSVSGSTGSSPTPRPSTPIVRPLTDMPRFLSAVFNGDGTVAGEIPRSALGLPGIRAFDQMVDKKFNPELMDFEEEHRNQVSSEDVDMPLAFPTAEEMVIGACTCGEDCSCPGCATHPDNQAHSFGGTPNQGHSGCKDSSCSSCFDCGNSLHIPAGITSIEHLISMAAANVPQPPRNRHTQLSGFDTTISPPSAAFSPDAAANAGFVKLLPLECCNGRCQCRPGECSCAKDCCGCCVRCACAEDAATPTQSSQLPDPSPEKSGGCCSGKTAGEEIIAPLVPAKQAEAPKSGSCCGTKTLPPNLTISTASPMPQPASLSPIPNITPPRLSPGSATGGSLLPSPQYSPLLSPHNLAALTIGGSGHHSPLISPQSFSSHSSNHSHQSSPHLSPGHSPGFHLDTFRLPSPGSSSQPPSGTFTVNPMDLQLPSAMDTDQTVGTAPPLRRASSTSQGHSHSQSQSNLSSRRATVTSGVTVSRSASTGKQVSKALALNQQPHHPHAHGQQHARPILPKASTKAHLAPPKGINSSSRSNSPTRRRASSSAHHSRSPSPAPFAEDIPSNRSVSGPVSSGHMHRASEPNITIPQLYQADNHLEHTRGRGSISGPIPMVTTSAPDETAQQVSFDPASEMANGDNAFLSDPFLQAYLNQLQQSAQLQTMGGYDQTAMDLGYQDQTPIEPAISGLTMDQTQETPETAMQNQQEMYQLFLQALANNSAQPHFPLEASQSLGGSHTSSRDPLANATPHSYAPNTNSADQGGMGNQDYWNEHSGYGDASSFVDLGNSYSGSNTTQPEFAGGQIPPSNDFATLFAQMSQPLSVGSNEAHERVRAAMQAQHEAVLASLQTGQPLPPHLQPGSEGYYSQQPTSVPPAPQAAHLPHDSRSRVDQSHLNQHIANVAQEQGHQAQAGNLSNPNMIDLSKPLDVSAMERILRALQDQQARDAAGATAITATGQAGHVSVPPPNSMPPPPVPSSQVHFTNSHVSQLNQFRLPSNAQSTLGDPSFNRSHQPASSTSSFDSFLAIPPSDSSGSASGPPSSMFSFPSSEAQDPFERFIVDNPGDGLLDMSSLDLGNKKHGLGSELDHAAYPTDNNHLGNTGLNGGVAQDKGRVRKSFDGAEMFGSIGVAPPSHPPGRPHQQQ